MTTINFDGANYKLLDEATFSDRLLPSPYIDYNDAQEGEQYSFMMTAHAKGDDGLFYLVHWIFDAIKGDEQELDSYDYSTPHNVEIG